MVIAARVALVQGASRGIGLALIKALCAGDTERQVFATCRAPEDAEELRTMAASDPRLRIVRLAVDEPASISAAARAVARQTDAIDLLINSAGILHEAGGLQPERRLTALQADHLARAFAVNATGPLLVARAFESLLRTGRQSRFAALSARVGSIGDNRLGGWYAYRMSKAALNMGLRTLAIEWSRGSRPVTVVALHPGTVATELSAPFRRPGARGPVVFTPERAASQLLDVLAGLGPGDSGGFFAWDGQRISW